jgi:hypothetical protein
VKPNLTQRAIFEGVMRAAAIWSVIPNSILISTLLEFFPDVSIFDTMRCLRPFWPPEC